MAEGDLTLEIVIEAIQSSRMILVEVPPTRTVGELVRELLARLGLPPDQPGWHLNFDGLPLPPELRLGERFTTSTVRLAFACVIVVEDDTDDKDHGTMDHMLGEPAPAWPAPWQAAPARKRSPLGKLVRPIEAVGRTITEFKKGMKGLGDEVESGASIPESAVSAPQRVTPARPQSLDDQRRATVRYYSRMNPERLYPLLVLITRDMVERVEKRRVEQTSSGPFKVKARLPGRDRAGVTRLRLLPAPHDGEARRRRFHGHLPRRAPCIRAY